MDVFKLFGSFLVLTTSNTFVNSGKTFKMMKGGQVVGDGSWTLAVFVTDLQVERRLRVHGGLHIGGVMIKLVDELGRKNSVKYLFLLD